MAKTIDELRAERSTIIDSLYSNSKVLMVTSFVSVVCWAVVLVVMAVKW